MSPFRARIAVVGAQLALGALVLSCNSPTLPLPPPNDPAVSAADGLPVECTTSGMRFVDVVGGPGSARPGALVMIFNESTGGGIIVTASAKGEYQVRIAVDFSMPEARYGNVLEIWQREGMGESTSISHIVHNPNP